MFRRLEAINYGIYDFHCDQHIWNEALGEFETSDYLCTASHLHAMLPDVRLVHIDTHRDPDRSAIAYDVELWHSEFQYISYTIESSVDSMRFSE